MYSPDRFGPMKVEGIAWQDKDAAGRVRIHAVSVEPVAKTDIEDAGHDRVDAVLRVLVRHELHAGRYLHADNVGTGFRRVTDDTASLTEGGNAGKGFGSPL